MACCGGSARSPWRSLIGVGLVVIVLDLPLAVVGAFAYHNDDLPDDDYYQPGDINIGALVRLYNAEEDTLCSRDVAPVGVQVASAIVYQIGKINADKIILKNISLGFAILNDCDRESVVLARASKFIPVKACVRDTCDGTGTYGTATGHRIPPYYQVAGVMGPYASRLARPVASLLSLYEIPVMSWSASSSELSDKKKYKYFSRAIPPDKYQVLAIVDILVHFEWTYISMLNTQGSYGSSGAREVQKQAKKRGICIAYSRELGPDHGGADYDDVIINLRRYNKARVIVLFVDGSTTEKLLLALSRNNAASDFLFIGTEGFQPKLALNQIPLPLRALTLDRRDPDAEFERFYREQNPWRDPAGNPWEGQFTPTDINCDVNDTSGNNSCSQYNTMNDFDTFIIYDGIGRVSTIVRTFALALDRLIQEHCPQASKHKEQLAGCIKGSLLLEYIRNVTFQGTSDIVAYDKDGDILGSYIISLVIGTNATEYNMVDVGTVFFSAEGRNTVYTSYGYNTIDVGSWDRLTRNLIINTTLLQWADEQGNTKPPESVCAKPCGKGEVPSKRDGPCCWECSKCRDNEIVLDTLESCRECPQLMWPDPVHLNTCQVIPPSYMHWYDPIASGLTALASFGLVSVILLVIFFVRHWERKVVKGSSRELMVSITIGLTLAYMSVFMFIAEPTTWTCYLNYFGFHLSCSLIFGPLFIKTKRMFRIFRAAERCKTRVRLADSASQITVMGVLILIQGLLLMIAVLITPPEAQQRMPVSTIQRVELQCKLPLQNLLIPLSYNIILLLLCAIFGFLTRKLPDNFNESWYIFIAVTTTMFVWIACLPTYFVAFYAYHKAALLALGLIMNGIVISLCLYAPKIYAIYYVDEKDIQISRLGSRRLSVSVGI